MPLTNSVLIAVLFTIKEIPARQTDGSDTAVHKNVYTVHTHTHHSSTSYSSPDHTVEHGSVI